MRRLPIVGVMGSGSFSHASRAVPLGQALAVLDVHLLTGGGGGVMAAVSRAFCETPGRAGRVLAVLPASDHRGSPPAGYPNEWIEIPIRTHLPLRGDRGVDPMSRNHVNVLTSDVVVALPGGAGTLSEVRLALEYGTPVVAHLGGPGELPGLPDVVPRFSRLDDVLAFVGETLGLG